MVPKQVRKRNNMSKRDNAIKEIRDDINDLTLLLLECKSMLSNEEVIEIKAHRKELRIQLRDLKNNYE